MQTKLANFYAEVEVLKSELAAYVKDRSLPLEDRWNTWKDAPNILKEHKTYYYDMYLGKDLLTECLYDDYGYERRQTICMVEFINRTIENKYDELFSETPEEDMPNSETWEPEGMDMLKEKILADNMGSFDYDW